MRVFLVLGMFAALAAPMTSSADEAAVKEMIVSYAEAFNNKQLDAVAGFWTEKGVHVDQETGERTEGRDAIRNDIGKVFEERPGTRLTGEIATVRFVKPDVASVEGRVIVSSSDGDPSETDFSAILVDQGGKWMIDSIEETPVAVPSNASEALEQLAFLEGRWVDDSAEARVDTVFRWTSNRAFLLRSYVVTTAEGDAQEGTQVIGFDPRSGELRSWSFNSDGSFGDATWDKNGDDWLIKSSQTLADGQAAAGTFVLSQASDDQLSLKLIGHSIEGVPQPTKAAVNAVRVVDQPVAEAAK